MNILRKHDWVITIITWVLIVIGIITIYSITYSAETVQHGLGAANRQLIFAVGGIGIYAALSTLVDYTYFKNAPFLVLLYAVVSGLLIVVLGMGATRGSARWIPIGPLNLEPSELAKMLVILISAFLFKDRLNGKNSLVEIIFAGIMITPILTLVLKQPDLSTTLSLIAIFCFIFLSSSPNMKLTATSLILGVLTFNIGILATNEIDFYALLRMENFLEAITTLRWGIVALFTLISVLIIIRNVVELKPLILIAIVGITLSFGYSYTWNNVIKDYQKDRINTFLNPEEDLTGSGYQVNQSIIATGSGQLWGRGFGQGTQSNLNFLPERHTDFIFASYAEEFGFIGTTFLVAMYFILILRIVFVGINSGDHMGFLICIGVATMLFTQFAINVGMNIGIMPVTGVTLPLVSYGGSSLLTTLIALGLVQSVAKGRKLINTESSLIIRE